MSFLSRLIEPGPKVPRPKQIYTNEMLRSMIVPLLSNRSGCLLPYGVNDA